MTPSYPFDTFSRRELMPPALPSRRRGRARSAATMALLGGLAPLTAAASSAISLLDGHTRPSRGERRTILINTTRMTKGLVLARAFHAAGHRVVLADTARYRLGAGRFSRAVSRSFTVPDPLVDFEGYARALARVVEREGVDLFVPVNSPAGAQLDAEVKERLRCRVLHLDAGDNAVVDDKFRFAQIARQAGLGVPQTLRIDRPDQLAEFRDDSGSRWLLKPAVYDPIGRQGKQLLPFEDRQRQRQWAATLSIEPERPWVLQRFVQGVEHCAHATVVDGEIRVFVCAESSPYQLNYRAVERPRVRMWVERFVAALGAKDAQLCFDFILDAEGIPWAIECNPRLHSAITLFGDQPAQLAAAYLGERSGCLTPPLSTSPTYWLAMELERLAYVRAPGQAWRWIRHLWRGKDAVFQRDDPWPFFALHHVQIPSLLLRNALRDGRWTHVDWCIGKVVEPCGD
ncbi:MAG: ATP-grasp enzyme [Myxococcota bacterium]